MTTTELIKQLANRLSITQKEARQILQLQIERMRDHLAAGRSVVLRGFGTLSVRTTAAHRGRLPGQREEVLIPEHHRVQFRASPKLRERLQEETTGD